MELFSILLEVLEALILFGLVYKVNCLEERLRQT